MKKSPTQLLTNYICKKTGVLRHGSELTYEERFKSGEWKKIRSFQCNQNMPFAIDNDKNWKIVRKLYGKIVELCYIEKI